MVRRAPGFTVVVVLLLGLGIGANTAMFSVLNVVMLRNLPVRDPHQLVELLGQFPGDPRMNGFGWKIFEHYRDHNHVFSDLIGISPAAFRVTGGGLDEQTVAGDYVAGDFFPALGVQPAIGRLIGARGQPRRGRSRGGGGELVLLADAVQPRSVDSEQNDRAGRRAGARDRRRTARVLRAPGRVQL